LAAAPAQVRLSNGIGQDLGPDDGSSAYVLHLEGDRRKLFGNGTLLWTLSEHEEDGLRVQTTEFADGTEPLVKTYDGNRLVEERQGGKTTLFSYDEAGQLHTVRQLQDGSLASLEVYGFDGFSHRLVTSAKIRDGQYEIRYYGTDGTDRWVSRTTGEISEKITRYPNGVAVRQTWDGEDPETPVTVSHRDESDLLVISDGTASTVYDRQGLLVAENVPDYQVRYRYDEAGVLVGETRTEADGKTVETEYRDGKPAFRTVMDGETVEKTIVYGTDQGRVETLYEAGTAYCDVTYASDGKQVLSVRYR
jgi:YD repeat-containing protein